MNSLWQQAHTEITNTQIVFEFFTWTSIKTTMQDISVPRPLSAEWGEGAQTSLIWTDIDRDWWNGHIYTGSDVMKENGWKEEWRKGNRGSTSSLISMHRKFGVWTVFNTLRQLLMKTKILTGTRNEQEYCGLQVKRVVWVTNWWYDHHRAISFLAALHA